jgi:hypothetical protein
MPERFNEEGESGAKLETKSMAKKAREKAVRYKACKGSVEVRTKRDKS